MDESFFKISGTLCNILRSANDQITAEKPEKYLINDFDLISGLLLRECRSVRNFALDIKENWKQSDYVIHALFWALRDKFPLNILGNMSGDKIIKLQDAISFAKKIERPSDEEVKVASQLCAEYARKNAKPSAKSGSLERAKNDTVRYSASLTITVAKYWDGMVKEINKWSDAVDERVAVDGLNKLRNVRPLNLSLNPDPHETTKPVVSGVKTRTVEKKEVKPVVSVVVETEVNPVIPTASEQKLSQKTEPGVFYGVDGEELWSTEYLVTKLGLSNVGYFYSKKQAFLKLHPEQQETMKNYFSGVVDGKKLPLFRAKYFEDLKRLMTVKVRSDALVVSTPDGDLWTTEKLALELGLSGKAYFQILKSKLLKAHPEYRKKMDLWFSANGALFNPKYFDDLKEIFPMRRNKRGETRQTDSTAPVAQGQVVSNNVNPVVVDKVQPIAKQPEPAQDELWTMEQLAQKLGYKDVNTVQVKRTAYLKQHPDEETKKFFEKCFVYTYEGKKRVWFVAKYFEELKRYIPPINENARPAEILKDKQGKELWKSELLAKKLGFNSTDYFLSKKSELKKRNPDIDKWFVPVGYAVYFYAEHFEELKALFQPVVKAREDIIKDKDGNDLWSTAKIAAELGLVTEMCFFNRKSRLLKRYPEVENYFVRRGNTVYFKSENFDNFKKLLEKMGERSYGAKENISDDVVQQPLGTVAEPKTVTDKELVPEHASEQIVIEKPTDLVGLKALDAMLTELQKRYTAAVEDQKVKEKKYNDLFAAVTSAEQELNAANQRVSDLDANIAKAKGLSQAYNEINQFLFDITQETTER